MTASVSRPRVVAVWSSSSMRTVVRFWVLMAASITAVTIASLAGCSLTEVPEQVTSDGSVMLDGDGFAGTGRDPLPDVSGLEAIDFASDPAGVPMGMAAPAGRVRIVYFGYLSCPDICPLTMADVANALYQLDPADAARVEPVFVTLDPECDSGARLVEYMGHFFPDRSFRAMQAGSTGALNKLAYHFEVQYSVPVHEPGEFYAIAHSGTLYVVDDAGFVRRELPFGTKPDEIATVLRAILAG